MMSQRIQLVGIKLLLGIFLYGIGMALYVLIQQRPWHTPWLIPWSSVDRLIPANAHAVWMYLSLYLMILVPWWTAKDQCQLFLCAKRLSSVMFSGLFLLAIVPTSIERWSFPVTGWSQELVQGLQSVDGPGNASPSMHAALGLAVLWVSWSQMPRLRVFLSVWLLALLWSCSAIRQHSLVDLLLGLGLTSLIMCIAVFRTQYSAAPPFVRWSVRQGTNSNEEGT